MNHEIWSIILIALIMFSPFSCLADSPVKSCADDAKLPACKAARGDRPSGWLGQGRSEVMARNGIVATSQPLAAQAGLRILMAGGNAIDAAVAAAAVLNLVEPMSVGVGGDLFAIFYIAKDKKLYQLNASGMAPTARPSHATTASAIPTTRKTGDTAPACPFTGYWPRPCRAQSGAGKRPCGNSAL